MRRHRFEHLLRRHQIAVAPLVLAPPARVEPFGRQSRASACRSFSLARPWLLPQAYSTHRGGRRPPPPCRPGSAPLAPLRRLNRESDRQDQHRAVEQRFDEERRAELVEARHRDGEHGDGEHRPPDVHPARPDRGRAEKRRGEGGQEIFLADRALADHELRLQHDPGEGRERSGGDEGERDVALRRDAVQLRRSRARAEDIEVAAERQVLEHDPEDQARDERIDAGGGHDPDAARDRQKLRRQGREHLLAAGVPGVEAVEHRARPEGRDEGIDLDPRDQHAVDEPDQRSHAGERRRGRPPRPALALKPDRQHLGDADVEAGRKVELVGDHRDEDRRARPAPAPTCC